MSGSKKFRFGDHKAVAASIAKASHYMTDHDWEDQSEPVKKEGGLIVSKVAMVCRRCGIVAGVIPLLEEDTICDLVLARAIMES